MQELEGWQHDLATLIVGLMYGTTYEFGRKVVERNIQQHGRLDVARVAYNTQGLKDIETFDKTLN